MAERLIRAAERERTTEEEQALAIHRLRQVRGRLAAGSGRDRRLGDDPPLPTIVEAPR